MRVWRLDTLPHVDIVDPVAGLILGDRPPLELPESRLTVLDEDVRHGLAAHRLDVGVGVPEDDAAPIGECTPD